jgi:hypothetical protein
MIAFLVDFQNKGLIKKITNAHQILLEITAERYYLGALQGSIKLLWVDSIGF